MKQLFHEIEVNTKGQGLYDFTKQTIKWLDKQEINNGILNINILHTSASLLIQENADPDVLYDLKNFFDKLAPMDNKLYKHTTEGKDDMPAHIKSALTNNQIPNIPTIFGLTLIVVGVIIVHLMNDIDVK